MRLKVCRKLPAHAGVILRVLHADTASGEATRTRGGDPVRCYERIAELYDTNTPEVDQDYGVYYIG